MYSAIGLDMQDFHTRTLRIAPTRLFGVISLLAHQPTPRISVPDTADKDLVAKADMLYSYIPPKVGLIAFNTQPKLTAKVEAIYSANGKLGVQRAAYGEEHESGVNEQLSDQALLQTSSIYSALR